jgi:hypothetical protein
MSGMILLPDWLITSGLEPPRQAWGVRVLDGKIADLKPNLELLAR